VRDELARAFQLVIADQDAPALKWAVNYAKVGLGMILIEVDDEVLRTQILYLLSNISRWRGEGNKEARDIFKKYIKLTK